MNNTFIPNVTPDGHESGEYQAAGLQPALPTECIKLPEVPTPPAAARRWPTGWLINEAAEITPEMWDSLQPAGITDAAWSVGARAHFVRVISEKVTNEKAGKIFPLSWDRVQFLADKTYQEWRKAQADAFKDSGRSMDGLRGMTWGDADSLIKDCLNQAGIHAEIGARGQNACHRIAQAAHKLGAEEMKKIMEDKNPSARDPKPDEKLHEMMSLRSRAFGEQAKLLGIETMTEAMLQDVPMPIPPGSSIWAAIRPSASQELDPQEVEEQRHQPGPEID